jgi:hypothetical protein
MDAFGGVPAPVRGDPNQALGAGSDTVKRSFRGAVNAKCRQCIYDPKSGLGTWRQQTQGCTVTQCPLWPYRPMSEAV